MRNVELLCSALCICLPIIQIVALNVNHAAWILFTALNAVFWILLISVVEQCPELHLKAQRYRIRSNASMQRAPMALRFATLLLSGLLYCQLACVWHLLPMSTRLRNRSNNCVPAQTHRQPGKLTDGYRPTHTHSLTHTYTHSLAPLTPLTHTHTHSLTHSTHSTHSLTHSLTPLTPLTPLTHSLIHSTHSTHSLTPLTQLTHSLHSLNSLHSLHSLHSLTCTLFVVSRRWRVPLILNVVEDKSQLGVQRVCCHAGAARLMLSPYTCCCRVLRGANAPALPAVGDGCDSQQRQHPGPRPHARQRRGRGAHRVHPTTCKWAGALHCFRQPHLWVQQRDKGYR